MRRRLNGVVLFSLLSGGVASAIRWLCNPWFMDQPLTYAAFTLIPLSVLGWWLGPRLPEVNSLMGWFRASVVLFCLSLVPPQHDRLAPKLVIVGIDGVTWTVADKIEMPALEGMVRDGQRGTLLAAEPLFSPLLWTTIATGQPPHVHGIQGLKVRADQAQYARFWDVARYHGLSVGLYKWLVTWPPPEDDVSGFTVPAWLAADAQTHPADLGWVKELELSRRTHRKRVATGSSLPTLVWRGVGGGLRWSTLWAGARFFAMEQLTSISPGEREAFLRNLRVQIDRDVFIASLHRHEPDVATFTVYVTDAISHTHWLSDGGHHVQGAYQLADQVLGEIRDNLVPGTPILTLSDHGFRNAGEDSGAHSAVPKIDALSAWLARRLGEVEIVRVGRKLVINSSNPVGEGELELALSQLLLPNGEPLYGVDVLPGQSGWSVSIANIPPQGEWERQFVGARPLSDWVRPGRSESGEHDEAGIVVLAGAGIEPGQLGDVSQVDVMPTILSLLALPVADDLPGRSWVPERVGRIESYAGLAPRSETDGVISNEERLKRLGYID